MTLTSISDLGLVIARYTDAVDQQIAVAQGLWGKSVNTDQTKLLGHMIRQVALLAAELNETLQGVYDTASGINVSGDQQDHIYALIGLYRQSAARSSVMLRYTVSAATTIPAGHRVKTAAGVVFQTTADLVFVAAGSAEVAAQCTVDGAFDADIDEVSIPQNTLYGLVSVTNDDAAIPGRLRETSSQFRRRHTDAVATSGDNDVASIYEAVAAVPGVDSAYVEEDTAAHTIAVSVIGGADADIGAAINANRTGGIPTVGTEAVNVYSETTHQTTEEKFSRAADVPFYVALTLTKNPALFPADGETRIRDGLIALAAGYRIKDSVGYYGLGSPINQVPGIAINSMYIGLAPAPTGTVDLPMTGLQRATLEAAAITIGYTS